MPATTQIVNHSLERCVAQPEFLHRFYDVLIEASPEIAAKFKETDFDRQTSALKRALYVLLFAWEWRLTGDDYLVGLAHRHGRSDLDVSPQLYDIWIDCLIRTVQEFDSDFDAKVEAAWRKVLAPGIEFMKSAYESQ